MISNISLIEDKEALSSLLSFNKLTRSSSNVSASHMVISSTSASTSAFATLTLSSLSSDKTTSISSFPDSLVGETLKCRQESSNDVDKNAVAIIISDSWEKKNIIGHVPQNISKIWSMFLKVLNTSIEVQVVGNKLNRGRAYGLEIPVIYRFYGQEKLVNWLIKNIEAVKKELECKVPKCLK